MPKRCNRQATAVGIATLMAPWLLNHSTEERVSAGVRVALTLIAAITSLCAVSAPSVGSPGCPLASTLAPGYTPVVITASSAAAGKALANDRMDAAGSSDLYGNEVIE